MTGVQLNSGIRAYMPIASASAVSVSDGAEAWELSADGQRMQSQLNRMLGAPVEELPPLAEMLEQEGLELEWSQNKIVNPKAYQKYIEQVRAATGRRDTVVAAVSHEAAQPWITDAWDKMSLEQRHAMEKYYEQAMLEIMGEPQGALGATPTAPKTIKEMFEDLVRPVVKSQEKLKEVTEVVSGYAKFFEKVSQTIKISNYLGSVDGDGNQNVNLHKMYDDIEALITEANATPLATLTDKAAALSVKKNFSNSISISPDPETSSGPYVVHAKTSELKSVSDSIYNHYAAGPWKPNYAEYTMSAGSYSKLVSEFDQQMSNIQNNVQTMTTELGHENSLSDSTIKLMTSSMSALKDMFMSFLRF